MDTIALNLLRTQVVNYQVNTGSLADRWIGNLPSGLTVTFSTVTSGGITTGIAIITGTVTDVAGDYTVNLWEAGENLTEINFSVSYANPLSSPVISCAAATVVSGINTVTVGAGPINIQLAASNSGSNWTGSFPVGTAINNFGLIVGTLLPGSYPIVVQASNLAWSDGYNNGPTQAATYAFTLVVEPAVPVIIGQPSSGFSGNSYLGDSLPNSPIATVQDAAKPVTWSATGLPTGTAINPQTGALTGKLNAIGNFIATLSATNATGTATYQQVLSVLPSQAQAFQFLSDDPTLCAVQIDARTGAVTLGRQTPFKAGETACFALIWLDQGAPVAPPTLADVKMGFRPEADFEADYILQPTETALVDSTETEPAYILATMPISGEAVAAALDRARSKGTLPLPLMADVLWLAGEIQRASATFGITVNPTVTEI